MNAINNNIIHFLERQTCATICCTDQNGNPHCFSCYYVFSKENCVLYFKSSVEAYHSVLLIKNPVVAGTIMPDKVNRLITRGAQLQGEMLPDTHPLAQDAYQQYHKKYPMALAIKGEVFTVLLSDIKMTDSKLGFGKKVYWKRQEQSKGVTNL